MMLIKPNRSGVADLSEFAGTISTRERGFKSLTRFVVAISVILAILMIAL
jgi:hypothetical protein